MRNIQYLIELFPNKTGKELLEIQQQDKLDDEKQYQKANEKTLALIEGYNKEGAYFKSTFGMDQYRYDKFTNFKFERGDVTCDVESIVGFYKQKRETYDTVLLERKTKNNTHFDTYSPQGKDRITKEEYDALSNYLDKTFVDFWGLIDLSQFR